MPGQIPTTLDSHCTRCLCARLKGRTYLSVDNTSRWRAESASRRHVLFQEIIALPKDPLISDMQDMIQLRGRDGTVPQASLDVLIYDTSGTIPSKRDLYREPESDEGGISGPMAPGMQVPTWGSGPPLLPLFDDVVPSLFEDGMFVAESANTYSDLHKVHPSPAFRPSDTPLTDAMAPALGSQLTHSPERDTAIVLQVDAAHSSLCGSTLDYTTSPEKVWLVQSGAVPIIA